VKNRRREALVRQGVVVAALALALAVAAAALALQFPALWGQRAIDDQDLLEWANDTGRVIDAVSPDQRAAVAAVATNPTVWVDWYMTGSTAAERLDAALTQAAPQKNLPGFAPGGYRRRVLYNRSDNVPPALADVLPQPFGNQPAYFLFVELRDASWIIFATPVRLLGISQTARIGLGLALLMAAVAIVLAAAKYSFAAPVRDFTAALRRFGANPRATLLAESGPPELRRSIGAFNDMQAMVQKFVEERTLLLAAISHDLRTPLTKMRLRGEFVEDEAQRAGLFRDVEDMREMIDSALAFFRDDFQREDSTVFDFSELLRTIADENGDLGLAVSYDGPPHLAYRGRPVALKRVFSNLVDNAGKYARSPELSLRDHDRTIEVLVRDHGPGIPEAALEKVFEPFMRLERSRNRATGGVGLGLTSARAVISAHGGVIGLRNRPEGGLEVWVRLPHRG
jgi:signal transduction histidine kinase